MAKRAIEPAMSNEPKSPSSGFAEAIMTKQVKEPTVRNKPRSPLLAVLLSIFVTGLGHMYSGSFIRGMVLFAIGQLLFMIFAISMILITPNLFFMLIAVGVCIAFTVYCAVDAASIAERKEKHYELAKYNRWYAYIGYTAVIFLIMWHWSVFVQAFRIPTGAMEPTLLTGNHILVNRLVYITSKPKRGDVIVFKYPNDPKVAYIKRLIGEPGDKVEMVGRTVYINDAPLKETYTKYIDPNSVDGHFGPYNIPRDNYFVMGDNRDNSQDSRYWGFVPKENLLGKAQIIYWSFQLFDSADEGQTRWKRIFQPIE
jgi:signal peptidase I